MISKAPNINSSASQLFRALTLPSALSGTPRIIFRLFRIDIFVVLATPLVLLLGRRVQFQTRSLVDVVHVDLDAIRELLLPPSINSYGEAHLIVETNNINRYTFSQFLKSIIFHPLEPLMLLLSLCSLSMY